MIMSIQPPKSTTFSEEELPLQLPIIHRELPSYQDIPKPVNPGKIMLLKMMVIMGTLGALLMVLSMLAILLGW
ncbi:MAG: hypothetical protein AAFY71_22340 [Bacteroidota bacterium]